MTDDIPVFPDAEMVVAAILAPALEDLVGDRIGTEIPANATSASYPLVRIQRYGGNALVREYLDGPSIQIDAWADTEPRARERAHEIARTARAALHAAAGTAVEYGDDGHAWVAGVTDALGLRSANDPVTHRHRFIFAVTMGMHD